MKAKNSIFTIQKQKTNDESTEAQNSLGFLRQTWLGKITNE